MWKDLVKLAKKHGVKVMVKIPLTRKIPMDPEYHAGDIVDRARELAILKSLLKRVLEFLDAYVSSGAQDYPLGAVISLAEEIRSRVVSPDNPHI